MSSMRQLSLRRMATCLSLSLSLSLSFSRFRSRKDSLESESSAAIVPHELVRTRQLESVHLKFNQESGTLIPLCLRGRLLHGRHFTYKSITGDTAITFVSTGVEGAFATEEHPYAAHGPWLQILLTEEFVERMLEDLQDLNAEETKLPKEYCWPDRKLKISILPDAVFDSPLQGRSDQVRMSMADTSMDQFWPLPNVCAADCYFPPPPPLLPTPHFLLSSFDPYGNT
ncbi:hypothetical protein JZ751_019890 [Albula glossodonta]|uniref:Suppressor of fused homolog n=1 Tax=Albula glossodonta TaxID=121402 RepID=A0A8T2NNE4_9TELE|nr:hypothetical protein JZ751_019890 [Albula glossodonta]